MNRVLLAVVASGVQSLVMLLALALTASSFDTTELAAAGFTWPALCIMEILRHSPGVAARPRMLRASAAVVATMLVLLSGLALAGSWQLGRLRDAVTVHASAPVILTNYVDAHGNIHRISVPGIRGESWVEHQQRAARFVALMHRSFPAE